MINVQGKPRVCKQNSKSSSKYCETKKYIKRYLHLYILLLLPLIYFIIFKYGPMFGNIIAFRKYKPGLSITGVEWVGLKYFKMFLVDPMFWATLKNSIVLSTMNLTFAFPIPILFALLLNEIGNPYIKQFVQTISCLPKFISAVVVVGLINELLSPSSGLVNNILELLGHHPVFFINEPQWFRFIYIASDIWQFMGWNAIIYLASLSNIDVQLYEAAMIDGANRFKQILHVTIPGMMPTIVITLILAIGYLLTLGFEKVLLLYTPSNSSVSDIIDTYVYRIGLQNNNYSYSTAVGLFGGLIGLFQTSSANYILRKLSDTSLF